jgi:hypothetical protein
MGGPGRLGRRRAEPRLDPVRWRRPGGGSLIRLVAVAVLLATAAAVTWAQPQGCAPLPNAVRPSATASSAHPDASPGSSAGPAVPRGGKAGPGVPRGSVGVPVRLAEPTALALVRAGDRVDLLKIDEVGGGTTAVAAAALVLSVTGTDDPATGGLLLALTPAEAAKAVVTGGHGFAVLIQPG